MQYAIYSIPIVNGEIEQEKMNKFLRSQKVIKVDKQLVQIGEGTYWSFCIQYIVSPLAIEQDQRKEKVDYKVVLGEELFKKFSILRNIRKQLADKDAVPAYAVFTDAELSEIVKLEQLDIENIKKIKGIGEKKVEKYAQPMLQAYELQIQQTDQ